MFLLSFWPAIFADTFLWNNNVGYSDFAIYPSQEFIFENKTENPIYKQISTDTLNADFVFSTYITNIHCSAHSKYEYFDSIGKSQKCTSPAWGIYCTSTDGSTYIAKFSNIETGDEYTSEICIKSEIIEITSPTTYKILNEQLIKATDANIYNKENYLAIDKKGNILSFKIAKKYETEIFSFFIDKDINSIGLVTFPGSKIKFNDTQLSIKNNDNHFISTFQNTTEIDEYLRFSTDPNEGYWVYLDRIFDESKLKLGGNYRLAIIKSEQGYDILYLDGATINKKKWKLGMLKGKLILTEITNVYDVVWYDSEQHPLYKDIKCQIENGNILTISFPYQKSEIRLYKVTK